MSNITKFDFNLCLKVNCDYLLESTGEYYCALSAISDFNVGDEDDVLIWKTVPKECKYYLEHLVSER